MAEDRGALSYEEQVAAIIADIESTFGESYWDDTNECTSTAVEGYIYGVVARMIVDGTFWDFITDIQEMPDGFTIFDQRTPLGVNKEIAFWAIVEELHTYRIRTRSR